MKNSFEIWKMNFTDYELDFTNYENLQTDFFSLPYFIREMIGKLRNKKILLSWCVMKKWNEKQKLCETFTKQHRIFKWKKLWWDITFPYFFQWNWDPSRPFAHPPTKTTFPFVNNRRKRWTKNPYLVQIEISLQLLLLPSLFYYCQFYHHSVSSQDFCT